MGALTKEAVMATTQELEQAIAQAMSKVGGKKENDLCKYLPVEGGGYMHHFTLRKMKSEQPSQLISMIEKYINKSNKPSKVSPKKRAPRGSRKRPDQYSFSKKEISRMISLARAAGDKDIVAKLAPKKSLTSLKKELISSIRKGNVEQELWNSYVEIIEGPIVYENSPMAAFQYAGKINSRAFSNN